MKPTVMPMGEIFPGCRVRVNDQWLLVTHVDFPQPDRVVIQYGDMGIRAKPECTILTLLPNARFWHWCDGWVKLTVPYGETLSWHASWRHDEGYSFCAEEWEHEGYRIVRRHTSGGSDCDGPLEHRNDSACLYSELQSVEPCEAGEPHRANWITLSRSQRDAYAEAAGY